MRRLDTDAGLVRLSANLSDKMVPDPLVDTTVQRLDTGEVAPVSDALAGADGDRFHTCSDVDKQVYLTVSSGIGAGVIAGGPITGWNANAGVIGHTVIDHDGTMTCGCGWDGHWEAYCWGNNNPAHVVEPIAESLPDAVDTDVPRDCDEGAR